ncbi:MAG: bifunctional phosphopantothenoylcysteine decarboxylase/phosphopantothenate--cysteine ligase CoaBC [Clostridiaceae bacterium]|jgi:phosphopantothenoylcysteine decarboxylase/phosphopantothenate--cysteine ligase|nr:bifunctional phosphopantothenoylcysteine decarboxylase/phosphopantothenate--cysteine ligase CoaBC [Clostridiaceae bacterium]
MLNEKNIVLGVTGCIAAYKACEIVSRLKKAGANVDVIMTAHATEFVQPLTFETLSGNRVVCDMFDRNFKYDVGHVSLAQKADLFLIAPATANVIAKVAHGIADDMLTTTFLACKSKKLICPAMNTAMLDAEVTESNIAALKARGVCFMETGCGLLACGDTGRGRLQEPEIIVAEVEKLLCGKRDLEGKRVLITAGATEEPVDGVRFLTNRSSGKTGVALAVAAAERGAEVTLCAGRISVPVPSCVKETVRAYTTADMYEVVLARSKDADIIIMSAAPADYRPREVFSGKLKAEKLTLELVKNPDIAAAVGAAKKPGQRLVIFAAETSDTEVNAAKKLMKKNADMVVANDVTAKGAGFDVDTNIASLLFKNGTVIRLDLMQKSALAHVILDKAVDL